MCRDLVFSHDACWAISYLSDGTNDIIQEVIEAGICGRLVELLLHPSPSVLIPVICTIGNIVTGDDMQTQAIINHGSLSCLLSLLTHNHNNNSIKRKVCWTISNITAGKREMIQNFYWGVAAKTKDKKKKMMMLELLVLHEEIPKRVTH
ncbi:hypothetical protein MtrunA17_Chr4g0071971 [Medicago truncatula]|uniref:Importin subunit alpha n=1 Tax=Medicago truncatula TaxID=3880 RepID=A0A396IJ61_MEDTR|nr:hypothetical protein MtrunA17_Chr4g0071971 [Medicago truncatula]